MIEVIVIAVIFSLVLSLATLYFVLKNNKYDTFQHFYAQMDERTRAITDTQAKLQTHLSEHLMKSFDILRGQLVEIINQNAKQTDKQVANLTEQTNQRLKEISQQVEKRLSEGFEKTNATFQDVIKRLAMIDEAQKKISELSGNVVDLQAILADKRSRGAFGEVQLSALVRNVLPEQHFSFQHTLSTGVRADCILFMPEPTGNIVIDAKFPLESYRRMTDLNIGELERQAARKQFKIDIKKHLQDIEFKYIIKNETAEGAMMFIPAEAIFAEIHAHYPELVEYAQQHKVWMASPTTLMAILTTASAVIKDDATRKQIHVIQEHLVKLGEDFGRFQQRMDKLSLHIKQAHDDVDKVHTSAKKISSRFAKIEKADLDLLEHPESEVELLESSE